MQNASIDVYLFDYLNMNRFYENADNFRNCNCFYIDTVF